MLKYVKEVFDMKNFELELSPEFLKKIKSNVDNSVKTLGTIGAFEAYNRGGGSAGNYDRHYDRSTRSKQSIEELELV